VDRGNGNGGGQPLADPVALGMLVKMAAEQHSQMASRSADLFSAGLERHREQSDATSEHGQ
jgi:hypothetical protein